jgi:hypothetical protein
MEFSWADLLNIDVNQKGMKEDIWFTLPCYVRGKKLLIAPIADNTIVVWWVFPASPWLAILYSPHTTTKRDLTHCHSHPRAGAPYTSPPFRYHLNVISGKAQKPRDPHLSNRKRARAVSVSSDEKVMVVIADDIGDKVTMAVVAIHEHALQQDSEKVDVTQFPGQTL